MSRVYTEANLAAGTKYTISLCAVNSSGALSAATTVSGTTTAAVAAPPVPTKLAVSAVNASADDADLDVGRWNNNRI